MVNPNEEDKCRDCASYASIILYGYVKSEIYLLFLFDVFDWTKQFLCKISEESPIVFCDNFPCEHLSFLLVINNVTIELDIATYDYANISRLLIFVFISLYQSYIKYGCNLLHVSISM